MKTSFATFHFRFNLRVGTLTLAGLLAGMLNLQAQVWTNLVSGNASGTWGTAANWSGGIPNATDAIADFSTLNITANSTVNNDASRTVGTLKFDDTAASHDWTLSGSTLTLATSSGQPVINVVTSGRTATLTLGLAGTQAISKTGLGTLILAGGTGNTFSGPIAVMAGNLGTLNGASILNVTNTIAVAAGATFNLKGAFDGNGSSNPFSLAGTGTGAYGGWGALNVQENVTINGPITLLADAKITHDWNDTTFNSTITGTNKNLEVDNLQPYGQPGLNFRGSVSLGAGALTVGSVSGALPVYLTASNNYTGGTLLTNYGKLVLNNTYALGTGGLTLYANTVLDMNANSISIASLSGTGGLITDNASGAGPTAITVNQSGATTFAGSINNGATRTLSLTLGGTGALALLGNNTCSGATAVNAGKLIGGTGGSLASSSVTVAAGATNGVQAVSYGAQWSCSSLTYNAGTTYLDCNLTTLPVSTAVAPLLINGNLTVNGTVNVIVRNGYWPAAGVYPLVNYTGSLAGSGSFVLASLPAGVSATLVNNPAANRIDLNVTAVPTVSQPTGVWTNLISGNAGGIWGISSNWTNGVPNSVNAVANFSTVTIAANSSVTNDTPHTVGTLSFANGSGRTWTVDGANAQLTLATSLGLPTINVTNTQVLLGGFNGTNGFVKNGNGALAIYGQNYSNALTGPILVNGGLLGTVNSAAFKYITGPITVASGASFEANASFGSTTFGNTIYLSGTGATPSGYVANAATPDGTYNGAPPSFGALDLHGNATYSGNINLNADSLITHGYNAAIITGPIVASGTGKNLELAITVSGQAPIYANGSINLGSGALTVNSVSGGGSADGCAVALNAANTYSGGTVLTNYAILRLGNAGALGSGGLTLYPNTSLNLNTYGVSIASLSGTGGIITDNASGAGPTVITVNQSGATTFAGSINNGATRVIAVTKMGAGSLSLSGVNTYSGLTTINNGTLVGVTGGSCANSVVTLANNATNGIQVVAANGQWTCAGLINNGNSTLDFDFAGVAASTTTAPLQINGNVTFNGTVVVNARNGTGFTGSTSYPLYHYTGIFSGNVPATVNLPPHVSGSLRDDGVGTLWLDISANTEPLTWTAGDGFWNTSTPNWVDNTAAAATYQETFVGDTVIFDDSATGSGPFAVVLNQKVIPASVTVNVSTKTNYSIATTGGGQIAGPGSLTKLGTGSLTLSTSNSYTGGTLVSQGLLTIGSGGTLGAASGSLTVQGTTATGVNSASLNLGNSSQVVGSATLGGAVSNGTLTASAFIVQSPSANGNLAVSANLAGAGTSLTLVTNGGGNKTLTLSGTNTYTGGTLVRAGTLKLGSDFALGTGSLTVQSGAGNPTVLLDLNGHTLTNTIANTGGDCYLFNNSSNLAVLSGPVNIGSYTRLGIYSQVTPGVGNLLISGVYSGGWYEKQGASVLILTATNTYVGSTIINGGVVRATDGVGITTANLILADNSSVGAVFESTGSNMVRSLGTGANQVQLNNGGCGFSAYGSPVTVSLGGLGTPATLVWGSTYFNLTNFILNHHSANASLALANPMDLNGTSRSISVDASVANINATISDSAAAGAGLTKNGAGTLNLNAVNSYTGTTVVAGGKLGGTGTLAGPLTIDAAATLSPGASIGTFTVNNSVSLNGTVVMELNRTNAQNADLLAASSVSFGGALTVNNLGPALQAGDTFHLFGGSISGSFTLTNLPALGGSLTWDTSALNTTGTITVAGGIASSPTILGPYIDGFGNLVIRTVTQSGYNYLLLSTTNLTLPITWITNSTTAGTGATITNTVPVNPAQPTKFFRYQVN